MASFFAFSRLVPGLSTNKTTACATADLVHFRLVKQRLEVQESTAHILDVKDLMDVRANTVPRRVFAHVGKSSSGPKDSDDLDSIVSRK